MERKIIKKLEKYQEEKLISQKLKLMRKYKYEYDLQKQDFKMYGTSVRNIYFLFSFGCGYPLFFELDALLNNEFPIFLRSFLISTFSFCFLLLLFEGFNVKRKLNKKIDVAERKYKEELKNFNLKHKRDFSTDVLDFEDELKKVNNNIKNIRVNISKEEILSLENSNITCPDLILSIKEISSIQKISDNVKTFPFFKKNEDAIVEKNKEQKIIEETKKEIKRLNKSISKSDNIDVNQLNKLNELTNKLNKQNKNNILNL